MVGELLGSGKEKLRIQVHVRWGREVTPTDSMDHSSRQLAFDPLDYMEYSFVQ